MKNFYILILTTCVFYSTMSNAQTTVTLQCSQSVELYSLSPDTPQSLPGHYFDQLNTNAWTYQGTPGYERSLLEFDLTQIPAGAVIISAHLNLYNNFYCNNDAYQNGQHSHITNSNESWLHRVTSAWSENAATWNNQPATDTVGQITLPQDTNPNQDYRLDVTAFIQSMHAAPSSSHGFMLRLKNEQNYACLLFASSRHPDVSIRPTLEVVYRDEQCVVLPSSQSVELYTLQPNTPQNTGSYGDQLNANAWTYQGNPGYERSLVDFDLTQIPVGASITSAHLNLYNNFYCIDDAYQNGEHSHITNSNESWLQRVTGPWSENTATWNNQPSTDTTWQVTLPQDTNPHQNYRLDVTWLIQYMHASGNSYGFMLRLKNEQNYACLLFASSRHPDTTIRPQLEVCYKFAPEGISEVNPSSLSIFPNPTNGSFTISFPKTLSTGIVKVFNSIGQEVYADRISNSSIRKEINLDVASGIYFVKMSDGKKVFTEKLVVE
jgi:hypothetical protein